jgi:hypothetical protein
MALRMHTTQKKKKNYMKKVPVQRSNSCSSKTNTTKPAPEGQLVQKRRLQEGNSAQAPSSSDQKILVFHPGESPHSQNNAFNKVIASHNQ